MATEMREKVNFDINVPVLCTMQYDEGKLVESRYGDQYQWTLEGNKIAWVAPEVEAQRQQLGIRKGEPFIVCKSEAKDGRKKAITWNVYRPNPANLEGTLRDSIAAAQAKRQQPVESAPAAARTTQQASQPTPHGSSPQGTTTPAAKLLAGALVAAIDAALLAEQYAKSKGAQIAFGPEDIRAMAATLYIQAARNADHAPARTAANGGAQWQQ